MYAPDSARRELDAGEVLRAVDPQHRRRVEQAARLGDDLVERRRDDHRRELALGEVLRQRRPGEHADLRASAGPALHDLGRRARSSAPRARRSRGRRCGCRRARRRARARARGRPSTSPPSRGTAPRAASRRGSRGRLERRGSGAPGSRGQRALLLIDVDDLRIARPQDDAACRRARARSRARCRTRPRRRCRRCLRALLTHARLRRDVRGAVLVVVDQLHVGDLEHVAAAHDRPAACDRSTARARRRRASRPRSAAT